MSGQNMIKDLQAGKVALDSEVIIEGWVRTRRDSKAGLSFIAVSDGTCFATMQVVAQSDLPNYTTEVLNLTSGCAIRVVGKLVAS